MSPIVALCICFVSKIDFRGGQVFFLDIPIFCNVFYPFACGGHFIIISLSDGSGFSGADGSV